jgi:uncharacterized protein YdiU (UPF0061 family)
MEKYMDTCDATLPRFNFDNTFARSLDGFFVPWNAEEAPSPRLVQLNHGLAEELGLDAAALDSMAGAAIFSGNVAPEGSTPLAQAYAGHQFGGFSPQLGDGRALLLGEVIDTGGRRRDIQLKGSGRTPFSRNGDGKAALGPVLREYLMGEAMHALGIPTTRALAAVTTGDVVYRETSLPGAVLTRVAASHIRVGTFQFFAARGETEKVRKLADYVIARHYPGVQSALNPYLGLFETVVDVQAALIARWMSVGFIHGVMNTDNMAISGETIDYGPCAFMDAYAPGTVFSSIDTEGRYAFANQPPIAQWNLARLAETLIPLVDSDADRSVHLLTEALKAFPSIYLGYWLEGMRAKIGLASPEEGDFELVDGLLSAMDEAGADYTLVFRRLSRAALGDDTAVQALFGDAAALNVWLSRWRQRAGRESIAPEARARRMDQVNPIYIPRNHKVEDALAAAVEQQDLTSFSVLRNVLSKPFDEVEGHEAFASPGPVGGVPYQTFCGT